jgi:hypothetical protein
MEFVLSFVQFNYAGTVVCLVDIACVVFIFGKGLCRISRSI